MTNIAVIGCGRWGPNHVRAFQSLEDVRVIAVSDTSQTEQHKISRLFPGVKVYENYLRLLESEDVDGVVIATPTGTHHTIASDVLNHGKHVLCEKPLCIARAEATALVELAEQKHCLLMVGHVFLFNPGICYLKDLVEAGDLGGIQYMSAVRTNLGPVRTDVNAAYDLAAHDIAVFNWILGTVPELVTAVGAALIQSDTEDVVFISMRYPGNRLASIHASWLNPLKVRQVTIVGTKKMATWDDLNPVSPVAIYDKGAGLIPETSEYGEFLRLTMWENEVRLPKISSDEPLRLQARSFVDGIRHGRLSRSAGEFGAGVVAVLDGVRKSLLAKGGPVPVEYKHSISSKR